MAYTTPPTWSPDTIVASSDLQILSDDITYLKGQTDLAVFSGAYATRGTNLSVSDSTDTDVTLTSETWDEGSWIAVTSATFTVPASAVPPGYTTVIVDIRANVLWAGNSSGARRIIINKTGTQIRSKAHDMYSASAFPQDLAVLEPAVAGDTFKLQVWQNSGGALNVSSASLSVSVYRPLS